MTPTPGDQSGDQSGDEPGVGDSLGRFRLLGRLGSGAMGVVYEALEENLGRRVALKIIAPALADDPDFRERFAREARALASLDSPHVVQVYAHGEEDGHLYLATQLIPDGDLGRMLRQWGPAPLGQGAALIGQVAEGLADAHAAGLAHRDIKPANVLVRRRGSGPSVALTAYLGDFGIARRFDAEETRLQGVGAPAVGTPSYMAPELHQGVSAGVTSDLYAVGCLLWVTLTGSPPYPGASEAAIIEAHLGAPVPQLSGSGEVVDALNEILRRALTKAPADRYQRADDLVADLRRVATLADDPAFHSRADSLAGAPATGAPGAPGAPGSPGAPGRGRRALAAVLALVLLAGSGAAVLAWGTSGDDGDRDVATDFGRQDPQEILSGAVEAMRALDTVRVSGEVRAGEELLGVDLALAVGGGMGGDCDGSISMGEGSAQLRRVSGDTWFRADEQFWIASTDAAQGPLIAEAVDGRWVLVPPDDVSSFGLVCDLDELLTDLTGAEESQVVGPATVTASAVGREVVRVAAGHGEPGKAGEPDEPGVMVSVAVDDPHHVLEVDAGRDGSLEFSSFDRALEVRAPVPSNVFDLRNFGR